MFGVSWLDETWKLIQEDWVIDKQTLMALFPLARTPMDKKSGESLKQYQKSLQKQFDSLLPWKGRNRGLRSSMRGKITPGEAVVVLGAGDTRNHPLYRDAKTIKES